MALHLPKSVGVMRVRDSQLSRVPYWMGSGMRHWLRSAAPPGRMRQQTSGAGGLLGGMLLQWRRRDAFVSRHLDWIGWGSATWVDVAPRANWRDGDVIWLDDGLDKTPAWYPPGGPAARADHGVWAFEIKVTAGGGYVPAHNRIAPGMAAPVASGRWIDVDISSLTTGSDVAGILNNAINGVRCGGRSDPYVAQTPTGTDLFDVWAVYASNTAPTNALLIGNGIPGRHGDRECAIYGAGFGGTLGQVSLVRLVSGQDPEVAMGRWGLSRFASWVYPRIPRPWVNGQPQ